MQPDIDSVRRAICQRQVMSRWLSHFRPVYAVNLLQEADNDVCKLSQCKLLADADSRSAIEWEIVPTRAATLPSLWTELVRVFSPEVLSTVHNVNLISGVSSILFFFADLSKGTLRHSQHLAPFSRILETFHQVLLPWGEWYPSLQF